MPSATTSYYSSLCRFLYSVHGVFFFFFFPFACSGVGGVLRVCYTHSNSCLLSEIDWHGGEERKGGNMVVNAGSLILFLSYFTEA